MIHQLLDQEPQTRGSDALHLESRILERVRGVAFYVDAEPEGGFSVQAPELPGVASQGETEEEALAMGREALIGVLEAYRERGLAVPWTAWDPPSSEKTKTYWVVIDLPR